MKKVFVYFVSSIIILAGALPSLYGQVQTPVENKKTLKAPKPLLRELEFMRQRQYPYPDVPVYARQKAISQMEAMHGKGTKSLMLAQQPEWRAIGPFDIGGRIKSVVPHPTKDGWVYVGAAAGGIWLTTNAGESWEPIFDYENGIAFGSIAINKQNPDILYAGTGEAVRGGNAYLGSGMYKTSDGGKHWKLTGLSHVGAFSKVYVHPQMPDLIVAGAIKRGQGFYISTDAGNSWQLKYEGSVSDVSINPQDPTEYVIGVTGDGIYKTNDAGNTWTKLNFYPDYTLGRISVQQAPSNTSVMYTLAELYLDGSSSETIGQIYRSTDNGLSWSLVLNGGAAFFNNQGFYNNYLVVHPTNDKIALAGGIDIWKTTSGRDWNNVTNGYNGGFVHVDQHHAAFSPINPNVVYAGNDGGMYKSGDLGSNWIEINNNLQVTQFYAMGIDNSQQSVNYGGTQDNGTLGLPYGNTWARIYGGDGFRCFVDRDNPNIIYGELYYGQLWKVDIQNQSAEGIVKGILSNDAGLWNSPFIVDYNYPDVFYHGRDYVYASYSKGTIWQRLTYKKYEGKFTSIASSRADAYMLYAGTETGQVIASEDGGQIWNLVSGNGLISRYVTDIETSYKEPGIAYVTYSGYGAPHVFKTTDKGKSWINISQTLPDVPCNAIAVHPDNDNMLFVATDIGVFASFDAGNTWQPFGRKLPRSPVLDLEFHTNRLVLPNLVLRAATHGRSMWEIDVPAEAPSDFVLINPAGGELLISETMLPIRWYGFDMPVRIEYSIDDGSNWKELSGSFGDENYYNWNLPNRPTYAARIRITSVNRPEQSLVSNSFTISLKQKGSILKNGNVSYIPYGIAYDGNNGLWTTSFHSNLLYKLNAETMVKEKEFTLPGDSLYTDLALDQANGLIYAHRMYSTGGGGGEIVVLNMENGNVIKQMPSAAVSYPIGLELVDGNLVVGERDGSRMLRIVNPANGQELSAEKNPYQKTYGPRGLCYDGKEFLYQVCTDFPGGGSLSAAFIIKMSKNNLSVEIERMPLENMDGLINARGISYDPADKNFWVSDYGGGIYKIAGFETVVGVDDFTQEKAEHIETNISPNPLTDFSTISFRLRDGFGNLKIEVYDILGKNIGTFFDKNVQKEEFGSFQIHRGDLAAGIYNIVFIVNGKQTASKKLIVIN